MEELNSLLNKCGFVKRTKIQNSSQIIGTLIGFQLPDDYRYYLENYEKFEGFIGKEFVSLYDINELLELNKSYKISDILIIGSNGASETIGIRPITQNSYQIVAAQYIQDVDDHIIIGNSFTNMLIRLNDGIEWFK